MKIRLEPKSSGLAELELYAETSTERADLETIRDSGFCASISGDREGTVMMYLKVLSPALEREILTYSRQTLETLDAVRAFLIPLANRSTELHALADTDVRITHIEEALPTCPTCSATTQRNGGGYISVLTAARRLGAVREFQERQ